MRCGARSLMFTPNQERSPEGDTGTAFGAQSDQTSQLRCLCVCATSRLRAMLAPMREARWTRISVAYFSFATASLVWPLFPLVGNHIEPRILGMPWSLTYTLGVVVLNAMVLIALYAARVVDARELVQPESSTAPAEQERGEARA